MKAVRNIEGTYDHAVQKTDTPTESRRQTELAPTRQSLRRVTMAIRHPFWTIGTQLRRLATSPAATVVNRAAAHLFTRSFPLRVAVAPGGEAEHDDRSDAARWVGPVNLRHRIVEALLCPPSSRVGYRARVPAGARFVCECGISPELWPQCSSPVEFIIQLHAPRAEDWRKELTVSVDPGRRWTDRRWRTVSVPLPATIGASMDVRVTLSTRAESTSGSEDAGALFGNPRFEWRRSRVDVRRSLATFAHRLRTEGVRGSLELLRTAGIAAQDAEAYRRWVECNTRSASELEAVAAEVHTLPFQPLISILVPVYNTDPKWLRACVESVRRQAYGNWELCLCDDASTSNETLRLLREYAAAARIHVHFSSQNGGISVASNLALQLARGEFVALLDHDDELAPDALAEVVRYLNAHPDTDVMYSDEDKLDANGDRCDPHFKPDWSPEHFLTTMYTCHLMVVRRQILNDAGGFRKGYEGAQDYDLLLRVMERTIRIHHIPRVLYHWRKLPQSTASAGLAKPWALDAGRLALEDFVKRSALDADVLSGGLPGVYRVRRRIRGRPLVSLVIPTAGRLRTVGGKPVDALANAIDSVVQKTTYDNYELIVVADSAGVLDSTRRALEHTRHQVLCLEPQGPFNFSGKVNAGAATAAGDHLVLFNDDLEVISAEWLTAMLEFSQEAEIGAVGAKLLYPDGRLQHIGIVLGVEGVAAHAFHQHPGASPGYYGSALIVRNYSAVTGACLMTRRDVYDAVGRFDEQFPTDFNDVDYCLRVRAAGYRIVFTPWSQLYHHESASFEVRRHDFAAFPEMRRRWADVIDRDPYYNPHLSRDFHDYRIDA